MFNGSAICIVMLTPYDKKLRSLDKRTVCYEKRSIHYGRVLVD